MSAARPANAASDGRPKRLEDILARSLEELVAAGRVDAACALAGLACAATRLDDAGQWRRFNALLHRWSAKAPEPARTRNETPAIQPRAPAGDDQRSMS